GGNFLRLGFGLGSGRCLLAVGLRFRGFRRFVPRLLLICPLRGGHLFGLIGVLLRRWLSLRFVCSRFGGSGRCIGAFRGLTRIAWFGGGRRVGGARGPFWFRRGGERGPGVGFFLILGGWV